MEKPLILFVQGVHLSDVENVETFFDDSSIDESDDESCPYDEIPNKYLGLDKWMIKTNILCKHCSLNHNNPPVFLPEYFTPKESDECNVGIYKFLFCSFPCAMTYITEHYHGDEFESKYHALKWVYREFTKDTIEDIPCAPYAHEITPFGGSMATYSITSFQRYVNQLVPCSEYIIGSVLPIVN